MSAGQGAHTAFEGRRKKPWARSLGLGSVLDAWASGGVFDNVVLDESLPPRTASTVPVPPGLDPRVRAALEKRGVTSLYTHQERALRLAEQGRHFVVATPTASGKSLCYNLPVLERLALEPDARALYLFPTKALSRDQEEGLRSLLADAELRHGAITFDGDTPGDARRAARERSGVLLTNPDMLHAGILPHHAGWARLFSNLRFVILDELHTYRGVFGSHLANVIRRLERVAAFHGSRPTFIAASATIGNPKEHAERILGHEVEVISESGAAAGPKRILVYNPPVVNPDLGIRASYLKSAVRLAVDLVRAEVPTLVFGQSRNSVEVMLKYLRDRLGKDAPAGTVVAYRGGYLPDQRRAVEAGLRSGEIRCVVATNALELGIDIGSLDAVICAGYPGTLAGTWQRFGRAGRREGQSLSLLVTSSAPLDQYVAQSAEQLVGAPVEHARIDPDNVEILIQHLKCAAFELPFVETERFGSLRDAHLRDALDFLVKHEVLFPAPDGSGQTVYHWATSAYPANGVSLRSVGWDNFVIIELDGDKTIAEMDWRSTHTMLHEQAIYQHAAEQYQVEKLDYENHKAYVRKVKPDYYTTAMTHTKVTIIEDEQEAHLELPVPLPIGFGEVSVVEKVVGYKKIKYHSHENVGYGDVDLPEMQMHTTSIWLTLPDVEVERFVAAHLVTRAEVIDALRGLLNAMHTVSVMGLMVDPQDLGRAVGERDGSGGSTAGALTNPTIFLYDSVPGGIGLAARLFDERESLLRRSRQLIEGCPCARGCPACIGPEAGTTVDLLRTSQRARVIQLLDHVGLTAVH